MASINTFSPDYAVAPGETLREVIEAKGISQTDLAIRTGLADKTISQIMNGVARNRSPFGDWLIFPATK